MNGLSGLQVQTMQQFKSEVFDQRPHVLEELTGVAERSELHDVTHVPEHGPSSHMQVTDQTSELLLTFHVSSLLEADQSFSIFHV